MSFNFKSLRSGIGKSTRGGGIATKDSESQNEWKIGNEKLEMENWKWENRKRDIILIKLFVLKI